MASDRVFFLEKQLEYQLVKYKSTTRIFFFFFRIVLQFNKPEQKNKHASKYSGLGWFTYPVSLSI